MFDWTKLNISYLQWNDLYKNALLTWYPLIDPLTGELNPLFTNFYRRRKIRPEYVARHKGLVFEKFFHKGITTIYLQGSLHYYKNDGIHNYDDYTFKDHINVIDTLKMDFGIVPEISSIHHIEIGIVLTDLIYPVKKIIDNTLIHATKGGAAKRYNFEEMNTPSRYKIMRRKRYAIKEYFKSLQFDLKDERLKFEVKYYRMVDLKKIGVKTLADTLDQNILFLIGNDLLKKWSETLLFDWSIDKSLLTKREKVKIKDWRNQTYWIALSETGKRNKFSNEKKRYNDVVTNNSENIHLYISDQIHKKWCNLTLSKVNNQNSKECNLTNSIRETKTSSLNPYPEWVYQLPPDHPERKKLRNDRSNRRNNLRRAIEKLLCSNTLFPLSEMVSLTIEDINELKYWEGTQYDILNNDYLIFSTSNSEGSKE